MRTMALSFAALVLTAGVAAAQPPPTQPPPPAQPPPAQTAPASPQEVAAPAAPIEILEQILVKVNGEIITKTDLEGRQLNAIRARRQQLSDEELRKTIQEMTPDMLVDSIDELLLLQRGKELGFKLSDEQFKRVLENIRKENKLETEEAFQAALKQEGMSMTDLRKQLERQMIVNQVQQTEVQSKIGVTEEEAKKYYAEHSNEFTTPASLTLRELVVNVQTDGKVLNVGLDEAAKVKCEQALARARAGESFEKLVAELSESASKANGGLVGPLRPDELSADIAKLLTPLAVGGVTEVFRTAKGWAILKLESRTDPVVLGFEQARDKIGDKVYESKRRVEVDKYLEKLRGQAIIEWKNDDLHKIYDARVAQLAKELAAGSAAQTTGDLNRRPGFGFVWAALPGRRGSRRCRATLSGRRRSQRCRATLSGRRRSQRCRATPLGAPCVATLQRRDDGRGLKSPRIRRG